MGGQCIRTLVSGKLFKGNHQIFWDGQSDNGVPVATGLYFFRLDTPEITRFGKMLSGYQA
jgi:flagellar hook assembly protein FlgD